MDQHALRTEQQAEQRGTAALRAGFANVVQQLVDVDAGDASGARADGNSGERSHADSFFLVRTDARGLVVDAAGGHLGIAAELAELGDARLDLFAEELRLAQDRLNEVTGEFTADDLLGVIFSRFCIGK